MLDHLGLHHPAQRVDSAVRRVLAEGRVRTPDLGGKSSTAEVLRAVVDAIF
jgi:tartrate dehydrogenase/decarboxylase/D-malate dehydrogenase